MECSKDQKNYGEGRDIGSSPLYYLAGAYARDVYILKQPTDNPGILDHFPETKKQLTLRPTKIANLRFVLAAVSMYCVINYATEIPAFLKGVVKRFREK